MAELFAELRAHHGSSGSASISSETMQKGLRMRGLFNFTASSPDLVNVTAFVAIACNKLQQMKEEANRDQAPATVLQVVAEVVPAPQIGT